MKIRPDQIAGLGLGQRLGGQAGRPSGFGELLAEGIVEADKAAKIADVKSAELLVGRGSIHETMIALEEAGIKLRTVGAVRDKVVAAYQDLTRMQI